MDINPSDSKRRTAEIQDGWGWDRAMPAVATAARRMRFLLLVAIILGSGAFESTLAISDAELNRKDSRQTAPELPQESGPVTLPEFPQAANVIELDPDVFGTGARVFLDTAAISQTDDGAVHYTVLIVSASGVSNVFFEAIRCESDEWRSFAYATRQGEFRPVADTSWRTLKAGGATEYRRTLARVYVCANERAPDRARYLLRTLLKKPANYQDPAANPK